MKRGRTVVSNEQFTPGQGIGQKLTEEEEEFKRKFIDFKGTTFPEINPIEINSKSGNKEYKLANYRYPCQAGERKGIVYFVHGFGDYCARYAYFAKTFAEQGYDFVGMDQRGFGYSEGPRGMLESESQVMNDHLEYFAKVKSKFGGKDVPQFMLGHSLGGLISLKLSIPARNDF